MGRRQNRKKTRKMKIYANSRMPGLQTKKEAARESMPEINLEPVDYSSLSDMGRAALDNIAQLTGRTRDGILEG